MHRDGKGKTGKIYFADKRWLNPSTVEVYKTLFPEAGRGIELENWTTEEDVLKESGDAEAVLLTNVPITRRVMENAKNLKVVGRCGIGVDTVDIASATALGVMVCNVPDFCVEEVATHSLALLLTLDRRLGAYSRLARSGTYGPHPDRPIKRTQGQTLGLIGYGRIARRLGEMALAVGLDLLVYDPFVELDAGARVRQVFLDTLLAKSDFVSVHTPLTDSTRHLIGKRELGLMNKDAYLVNTSRGPIVDTFALIEAVQSGVIAGAGLDVIEGEPVKPDHPVFDVENIIYTPHTAMYSEEAMLDVHRKSARQVLDALAGRWPANVVNPDVRGMWEKKFSA